MLHNDRASVGIRLVTGRCLDEAQYPQRWLVNLEVGAILSVISARRHSIDVSWMPGCRQDGEAFSQ
ncbi:hypothetical protein K8O92_30290 [Nocardia asteroides]|uniref:hypothetical protein n=1 Tax=Nocardia TaxID=1817 RepID=UPI00135BC21B|nr:MULTISPECIES: hypothetical protein [Nocardia]UAK31976.1 hypothetical protein K8O92_30290 [Nocardia asteroides]